MAIGGRVLLIEESARARRSYERILLQARLDVESVKDLASAARALAMHGFDAVLASVPADDDSGRSIVGLAREHDRDLPVILVAPTPSHEAGAAAVEGGAWRYLSKPVELGDIERLTWSAVQACQAARARRGIRRRTLTPGTPPTLTVDRQSFTFERAWAAIRLAYEPIVNHPGQSLFGHRAILQSGDPVLSNVGMLLDLARRLGRLREVDHSVRALVARRLLSAPAGSVLIRLHDEDLLPDGPQMTAAPSCRRIILDVTPALSASGPDAIRPGLQGFRQAGHPIALQHTGDLRQGLEALMKVAPDLLELAPSVIRHIDRRPVELAQLASLISACRKRGIQPVASGVNSPGEREALSNIGVELMSGQLLAAAPCAPLLPDELEDRPLVGDQIQLPLLVLPEPRDPGQL